MVSFAVQNNLKVLQRKQGKKKTRGAAWGSRRRMLSACGLAGKKEEEMQCAGWKRRDGKGTLKQQKRKQILSFVTGISAIPQPSPPAIPLDHYKWRNLSNTPGFWLYFINKDACKHAALPNRHNFYRSKKVSDLPAISRRKQRLFHNWSILVTRTMNSCCKLCFFIFINKGT